MFRISPAVLSGNIFADVVLLKLKEQWMIYKHEKRPLLHQKKACLRSAKEHCDFRCKYLGKLQLKKKTPCQDFNKKNLPVLLLRRTISRVIGVGKCSLWCTPLPQRTRCSFRFKSKFKYFICSPCLILCKNTQLSFGAFFLLFPFSAQAEGFLF